MARLQVPIKDEKRVAGTAIGAVRMDHDPGERIRVENGELDLSRS